MATTTNPDIFVVLNGYQIVFVCICVSLVLFLLSCIPRFTWSPSYRTSYTTLLSSLYDYECLAQISRIILLGLLWFNKVPVNLFCIDIKSSPYPPYTPFAPFIFIDGGCLVVHAQASPLDSLSQGDTSRCLGNGAGSSEPPLVGSPNTSSQVYGVGEGSERRSG